MDTGLYTLPCRSVCRVGPKSFGIASSFCISTAPAQPSATILLCIRPYLFLINSSDAMIILMVFNASIFRIMKFKLVQNRSTISPIENGRTHTEPFRHQALPSSSDFCSSICQSSNFLCQFKSQFLTVFMPLRCALCKSSSLPHDFYGNFITAPFQPHSMSGPHSSTLVVNATLPFHALR